MKEKKTESKKENQQKDKVTNDTKKNIEKGHYSKVALLSVTVIAILIVLGMIAWSLNTVIAKQNYVSENPIATIDLCSLPCHNDSTSQG